MNKKLPIFVIIVVAAIAALLILRSTRDFNFANQGSVIAPEIKKVSILAFGDMMLDRNVFLLAKKAGDFNYPFLNIDSFLQTGDMAIANLEGSITDFASVSNTTNRMRFTVSPQFLEPLKTRFQVLSLANNHMLDFDEQGYGRQKIIYPVRI